MANDTDVDNANANLDGRRGSIVATNGTAVLRPTADVRFTPDLNKNSDNTGAFTVTYRVTDGSSLDQHGHPHDHGHRGQRRPGRGR